MMHKMKVAAVQMRAELGNVKSNLSTAEALVREAFRKGANGSFCRSSFRLPLPSRPTC
jgi:hypothetical protein